MLRILVFIILLFGAFALSTVWRSGAFKKVTNSFSGTTQRMEGLAGVEDIAIDQSTGIAFLSSDDRWSSRLHKQPVKGKVYRLNLNDSVLSPIELTANFPQEDFHPHGISFFNTPDNKKILFVINHRQSGNFIERFEFRNDSLKHLESIKDELIVSPNDLVGVDERKFYVANDHDEKVSGWRGIKDLLSIGTGNVCYFDGDKTVKTTIAGVKYANGINVSPDGNTLYLASTTGKSVFVYDRNIASGTLTKNYEIDTNTGVDNIDVDPEGNLWIGCHPQLLKFLSHAKDEASISPSEIIRLKNLGNGKFNQETIYINDGSEISASAVGAVYKNLLLIGPVFQRHIIVAKMK